MIPDLFQYHDPNTHIGLWKSIIGLSIVIFASFVGVEIRLGKDDDE